MIYKNNKLTFGSFNVDFLAKKFNTPIYCYSLKEFIVSNALQRKTKHTKQQLHDAFFVR